MRFLTIKIEKILLFLFTGIITAVIFNAYNQDSVNTFSMPTSKKVIIIDPGHGGWDVGKPGIYGANEDDINLEISKNLQKYLEQSGAIVIMTREEDKALAAKKRQDLSTRKEITNHSSADVLVSIHQNSYPKESAQGAQVFYHNNSEKGKLLAECIQQEIRGFADTSNKREVKANTDYYLLKQTDIPSVIVECGFLTNAQEEKKLNTENYQEKIAWAIYKGLITYFDALENPEKNVESSPSSYNKKNATQLYISERYHTVLKNKYFSQ